MATSDPLSALNPAIALTPTRSARAGGLTGQDAAAQRLHMKQLAQEFEAMLMNEMLADWRNSLLSDDSSEADGMAGMGTLTDMVGSEFGRALSRAGGLGIADVLLRSFERQLAAQPASAREGEEPISGQQATVTGAMAGMPVRAHATVPGGPRIQAGRVDVDVDAAHEGDSPLRGTVTSAFGWRPDPFTGQTKFHAGLDLRMAYGQEVASLAPGTVSYAGEQGGYGLTVVVDHPNGLQTRYAHLSSTDVQVGDPVRAGQRIARSGNSGRSTAPHLHVELLSEGRPVDPSGLLKRAGSDADWTAYRTPSSRSSD